MPKFVGVVPHYIAIQWTGSNEQEFLTWVNQVENPDMTAKVVNGVLHLCKPNQTIGFFQIPMNWWLVSTETWGTDVAQPYGGVMSPEELTKKYVPSIVENLLT